MAITFLVDSNIIIYHLNGNQIATDFLQTHYAQCAISQITYIEVLSFNYHQDDVASVVALLDGFTLLDVNKAASMQCIENRKIKKVKIPDNIIAATAKIYDLTLVTHNTADFLAFSLPILDIISEG